MRFVGIMEEIKALPQTVFMSIKEPDVERSGKIWTEIEYLTFALEG